MKRTISRVGYAQIEYSGNKYSYGDIIWFESEKAGGREFDASPRGDSTKVYADGKAVFSISDNDGYDIKLQLLDIVDDIEKDWLGNEVDNGAVAEYSTGTEFPKFALVVCYTDTLGKCVTEFYYQCQVAKRPNRAGKTSEGSFSAAFFDIDITSSPRENDPPEKRLVMYKTVTDSIPEGIIEPREEM